MIKRFLRLKRSTMKKVIYLKQDCYNMQHYTERNLLVSNHNFFIILIKNIYHFRGEKNTEYGLAVVSRIPFFERKHKI